MNVCVWGGGVVFVSVSVCVWVCKHRQPRTYSDTPPSVRGQHCKQGRSTICGYVQTVANCLLMHIGICWRKKDEIMCPQFYIQSVPKLPVVRRTRTSLFSVSNIIVLDCRCLQVCVCVCVCNARCSTMFCWEPEGRSCHRLCTPIAQFCFLTEHRWIVITPFWLSTDDI